MKAVEAYESLSLELEKSNARADSLEGFVSKLEMNDVNPKGNDDPVVDDQEELNYVKIEVEKLRTELEALKAKLAEKDFKLENISEENKFLNEKLEKTKLTTEIDTTKMIWKEALMKVGYLTEEADKSSRKVVRVTEQLDLAQAANAEIEAELRRLTKLTKKLTIK
ncbi:interactor of constitutive active ROPs 2, chloroplastic-like protein [Tanacetum coccineum]